MSSSLLKNWIEKNESLSTGLESLTDGETTLTVIESPEASVEDELAELVEVKIEQDEIERDTDELVAAQESLEAYGVMLKDAMDNGGVTAQSAAFLRHGLEHYEELFGIDPLSPSVEAFGGSASQSQSTQISLEAISDTLKKGWEALKRALTALMNAVRDVYARATSAADRLNKKAAEVTATARKLPAKEPKETELELKGISKLCADGEYVGDNIDAIRGFVHYMTTDYKAEVLKYLDKVAAVVGNYDPTADNADAQVTAILDIDSIYRGFKGESTPAKDSRFPGGTESKRTAIMAGNKAMYIARPDDTSKGDLANLSKLGSKLSVSLLEVPTAKKAPESTTLKVGAPRDLANTANKIALAAGAIAAASKDEAAIKKAVDSLIKAGDKLRDRASGEELNEEQRRVVDALLRGLSAVQKLLGTSVSGAMSYGVNTLHAQLRVVQRQLALYPTGTTLPAAQ